MQDKYFFLTNIVIGFYLNILEDISNSNLFTKLLYENFENQDNKLFNEMQDILQKYKKNRWYTNVF